MAIEKVRCVWAGKDPQMVAYHDEEWGVPEYDSRALWEKLMLDGFQAGLSWSVILRKRDAFRKAFLKMRDEGEDFSTFVWTMAGGKPIRNAGPVPVSSPLSEEVSKALKKRGFKFVGPVIVYAWMQAVGIVNDHSAECFRRKVK
jgi:DNA-3-methyladenine glycosylase I